MFSTIIAVLTFGGLSLLTATLWALLLRIGLRWSRVQDVSTRRLMRATVAATLLQIVLNFLFSFVEPTSNATIVLWSLAEISAAIFVPCTVIALVYKIRFLRAIQAWLPTLPATGLILAFILLVLRPFIYESFSVPTNSMAPTLIGNHWTGVCPECGKSSYCRPILRGSNEPDPPLMICENFHVATPSSLDKTVNPGDHILVAKFVNPRRWDAVVFQHPRQPETLLVKRLVGLPGETVHIEDGAVWINGERQNPPESLQGIEYGSEVLGLSVGTPWGTKESPAVLGDGEYFVLGDFSLRSSDSRNWQQSTTKQPPYAVPRSSIKGVVTHTYWPINRIRIHR